jgi:hypothetical protein
MGLEFHPVSTGPGNGVDVAMSRVEATVMGLRYLGDNNATFDSGKKTHGVQATFALVFSGDASMGVMPRL